jgi:hypothetical protein
MPEREEAWMRIIVLIVTGVVLTVWKLLVIVLGIFQFFYTAFKNRRREDLAELCNMWVSQVYIFLRYMTFASNSRPFPFTKLGKDIAPVEINNGKKR